MKPKTPKRLKGFGAVVKISKGLGKLTPETPEFYWWRNKAIETFWIFLLVGLNFYLVLPFFGQELNYSFSAPLAPFFARAISLLAAMPYQTSVSTVVLLAYIFSPLSLYFLVKEITNRLLPAVSAALLFSSPLFKSRLMSIFFYNDGAHIAALTFIPLVAYLALRFLREGTFILCLLTSLGIAAVALTSPFGIFILGVFLAMIVFSEVLLGQGRLKLVRMATTIIFAVGLAAFWYNPEFAYHTFLSQQGKELMATLSNLLPLSFFLVPVLGVLGFLLFEKKPFLQPLFIALGLTIVFFLISFAGRIGSGFFVSHPDRYLPELSFALCFLLGIIITAIFDFLRTASRIGRFRLNSFRRAGLVSLFLTSFFLPLTRILLKGRSSFEELAILEGDKVLGAFVQSQMDGLGQIRGQTGFLANMSGYFITSFTLATVGYLVRKRSKR